MLEKPPTRVVGRRVGAFLVDLLITTVVNTGIFFALAEKRPAPYDEGPDSPDVFGQFTVNDDVWVVEGGNAALYYTLVIGFGLLWWVILPGLKGWTPGKRLLGIRVVDENGHCPAGIWRNLVRQLMWVADAFPYLIPYLTGFIVALSSPGQRRVGDMVAGTYVVRADAVGGPPIAPPQPVAPPPPPAASPPGWHPDPQGEKRLRWWDGTRWTDQTAD